MKLTMRVVPPLVPDGFHDGMLRWATTACESGAENKRSVTMAWVEGARGASWVVLCAQENGGINSKCTQKLEVDTCTQIS